MVDDLLKSYSFHMRSYHAQIISHVLSAPEIRIKALYYSISYKEIYKYAIKIKNY